jgi:hypothetical protein
MIIKEEWVHSAVEYLREQSNAAAAAKGNLVRAEYHRRKIRARLILESPHTSQGLREAYAESHEDYAEICEKLAKCEEHYEWHRNERNKAETICEMWRTQSATLRGLGRVA